MPGVSGTGHVCGTPAKWGRGVGATRRGGGRPGGPRGMLSDHECAGGSGPFNTEAASTPRSWWGKSITGAVRASKRYVRPCVRRV